MLIVPHRVVQLIPSICSEHPIILNSLSSYLLAGSCVRVHQHKNTLFFWDPLYHAVEPMPERSFVFTVAVEHAVPCCCRDCPPWSPRFLNPQHRYVFCCCLVQHDLIPPIAVGSPYRQTPPDIVSSYLDQCRFLPLPSLTCCCPCEPTSSPGPLPFSPASFYLLSFYRLSDPLAV